MPGNGSIDSTAVKWFMDTLFPLVVESGDIPEIGGLSYFSDYLSEGDEQSLVQAIDRMPWNIEWRRRRQPYGGAYGKGDSAPPIPAWGQRLAARLLAEGVTSIPFDQMLVNEYLSGQGIALHRDYEPYGRTVVSLSLLSPCVMDFRHPKTGQSQPLLLERRSLLVLSDTARYDWQHGIAARKRDNWQGIVFERGRRVSITFRFVEKP